MEPIQWDCQSNLGSHHPLWELLPTGFWNSSRHFCVLGQLGKWNSFQNIVNCFIAHFHVGQNGNRSPNTVATNSLKSKQRWLGPSSTCNCSMLKIFHSGGGRLTKQSSQLKALQTQTFLIKLMFSFYFWQNNLLRSITVNIRLAISGGFSYQIEIFHILMEKHNI